MARYIVIDHAFSENIELAKRVHDAVRYHPKEVPLFLEIAEYICALRDTRTNGVVGSGEANEPLTKRRKLEHGTALQAFGTSSPDHNAKVIFEAREISFSIPMRKKLHLEIAEAPWTVPGTWLPSYRIRARNPASGELEYKVGLDSFKYALRLPVPEKAQKQYNFVLLPKAGLGISDKLTASEDVCEPLVWTINDGPQKVTIFNEEELEKPTPSQDGNLIEQCLTRCLKVTPAGNLIQPEDAEFASSIPEAHRKGEKAYHVKAFRGSKDGYLFFLSTGIFFGFKKPLMFFPFDAVNSISYTSVLQRTFNLNISVQVPEHEETKEYEFSMIDQADFAGIDAYIKRHGLQDASLAESRKAKKLNLNGSKKGSDEVGEAEGELQSELQKAQQDIEDAEDEEEEDYDPGSEGQSDGSGESSEEDEDYNGDDGEVDRDLVAEELGSEAEDAVPDPEDKDQL